MLTTAVNRNLSDAALDAQLVGSAFVLGGDGHFFFTGKRDYVVTGSFTGSRVAGLQASIARLQRSSARYYQRPDATHVSFDPAAESLSGWSLQSDFNKNDGSIRPNASFWAVSPGFEVNDAGYMTNADRMGGHAALVFLKPTPDTFSRNRQLFVAKWNTWNFAGDAMGDGYFANFYAQLRNYWSISGVAHAGRWVYSDRLTRGGPMMRAPGFTAVSASIEGDERKPVVWELDGSYETRPDGSWSGEGEIGLTFRPLPTFSIEVGPTFQRELTASQYVRAVMDPAAIAMYGRRYVFGALDQTEFGMETRLNLILSPRMSLQMYLQPLLSNGRYHTVQGGAPAADLRFRRVRQGHRHDQLRRGERRLHGLSRRRRHRHAIPHPESGLQLHLTPRQHGLPLGVQARLHALRRLDAAARGRDERRALRLQPGRVPDDARPRRQRVHGQDELLVRAVGRAGLRPYDPGHTPAHAPGVAWLHPRRPRDRLLCPHDGRRCWMVDSTTVLWGQTIAYTPTCWRS